MVSENYYLKGETDQLVSSAMSSVSQTADDLTVKFQTLEQDVNDVAEGADARFKTLETVIRASAEGVEIGRSDSDVVGKYSNDRYGLYGTDGTALQETTKDSFLLSNLRVFQLGPMKLVVQPNGSISHIKA